MLLAAIALAAAAPLEQRCGWLDNPTPQNWWLTDRDAEWTLSTQGADPAPGWEDANISMPRQWVKTNGSYGYGCACARMRVDRRTREILEVKSVTGRPLAACRADRRLPRR